MWSAWRFWSRWLRVPDLRFCEHSSGSTRFRSGNGSSRHSARSEWPELGIRRALSIAQETWAGAPGGPLDARMTLVGLVGRRGAVLSSCQEWQPTNGRGRGPVQSTTLFSFSDARLQRRGARSLAMCGLPPGAEDRRLRSSWRRGVGSVVSVAFRLAGRWSAPRTRRSKQTPRSNSLRRYVAIAWPTSRETAQSVHGGRLHQGFVGSRGTTR